MRNNMKPTTNEIWLDFTTYYPGFKGRVQRYEPVERSTHAAIYIWIDDYKYYYSYGAKVLQPAYRVII